MMNNTTRRYNLDKNLIPVRGSRMLREIRKRVNGEKSWYWNCTRLRAAHRPGNGSRPVPAGTRQHLANDHRDRRPRRLSDRCDQHRHAHTDRAQRCPPSGLDHHGNADRRPGDALYCRCTTLCPRRRNLPR